MTREYVHRHNYPCSRLTSPYLARHLHIPSSRLEINEKGRERSMSLGFWAVCSSIPQVSTLPTAPTERIVSDRQRWTGVGGGAGALTAFVPLDGRSLRPGSVRPPLPLFLNINL